MIDITYDRKAKEYQYTHPETGEIITAPSGHKHELFTAVIAMLDNDLYTAAVNWLNDTPQLERLAWRGVELVAAQKLDVYPAPENGLIAMVDSSDEYGRYALKEDSSGRSCQCRAYVDYPEFDQYGRAWCKHLAAYHLYLVSRAEY